ncbi:hypothetical protein [Desulfurivibrio sp. C05AmB]|jgi:hypothetical protein|uniref:hypothetical protein n=1 Tax=Desulfurivibrio sp. C05AmB TaxID=3374371 RepID=UPI00376F41F0
MLSQCPHCRNKLELTAAQQEKIRQALAALPAGKTLKINCPLCQEPIHLEREGSQAPGPKPVTTAAPAPPDISWLQEGAVFADQSGIIRDIPLAMVLMHDEEQREPVATALEYQGYKVEFPPSAAVALKRLRFVNFAAVVLHSGFEGGTLAQSVFHRHLRKLPMTQRRLMLYVLVGPEFHTLYDLEALANSANLVVNENDLPQMELILKKAIQDYQLLFGPYLDTLKTHGKL